MGKREQESKGKGVKGIVSVVLGVLLFEIEIEDR
jgi:hypothetical protein